MSSPRFEGFLARLYSDERFAARFIAAPDAAMGEAGLDPRERQAALRIDALELRMACGSFAAKRSRHRRSLRQRLQRWLQRQRS